MSSALSFIPRKLRKASGSTKTPGNDAGSVDVATEEHALPVQQPGRPKPSRLSDLDHATLVALALSDYALWTDRELREKLGVESQSLGSNDDFGYISLNHLFERSPILASLLDEKPGGTSHINKTAKKIAVQAALAKAIRTHASEHFDVRLLLHSPQSMPRFGKQKEVEGGYEIRRKRRKVVALKSKSEWDACTLYIENIPTGNRSYAGVIQFINALLRDASTSGSSSSIASMDKFTCIQGIAFPLHHKDKPDARPTCKGFAVVTFASEAVCQHLLRCWPWFRESSVDPTESRQLPELTDKNLQASQEAYKFGFRTLTKARWLELKAEYLNHRQQLVDEINAYQDTQEARPHNRSLEQPPSHQLHATLESAEHTERLTPTVSNDLVNLSSLNPTALFPPNCLVFVKHIHPESTKTILRHLFAHAFKASPSTDNRKTEGMNCTEGLDYVDFNKGMDTCHLRLATPQHTATLINCFMHSGKQIVQTSGLDEVGVDISSSNPTNFLPITIELVTGRPEELYWEKVPLKVKKAAVERAIRMQAEGCDELISIETEKKGSAVGQDKRKRESDMFEDGRSVKAKRRRKL